MLDVNQGVFSMALYYDIDFGKSVLNSEKRPCCNCGEKNEKRMLLFWSTNNGLNLVFCINCINVVKGLYKDVVKWEKDSSKAMKKFLNCENIKDMK